MGGWYPPGQSWRGLHMCIRGGMGGGYQPGHGSLGMTSSAKVQGLCILWHFIDSSTHLANLGCNHLLGLLVPLLLARTLDAICCSIRIQAAHTNIHSHTSHTHFGLTAECIDDPFFFPARCLLIWPLGPPANMHLYIHNKHTC